METTAAVIATALLVVIAVFQLALAGGAPLGAAAWGGRHERTLPRGLRVASAIAGVVVYPAIVTLVLASADVVEVPGVGAGRTATWILTAFFGLGTLANAASPSKPERLWAPVSLLIAICCGVIARAS